jgi:hypothetical protein
MLPLRETHGWQWDKNSTVKHSGKSTVPADGAVKERMCLWRKNFRETCRTGGRHQREEGHSFAVPSPSGFELDLEITGGCTSFHERRLLVCFARLFFLCPLVIALGSSAI